MRAIYGLNPEAATNTSPVIFFGIFLDDDGNLLGHGEEAVRLVLNGDEVNDSYEFDYQPGSEYELEASLGGEMIRASVKAPDISGIFITSLPDTVCDNEPFTVVWEYAGEYPNDGIVTLVYDFRRPEAARLPPSTTSYTIPAETFGNGGWGDRIVQVISQRAVLFPKLAGDDQSFEGAFSDLGYEGSFFTTFVASEERLVHVLQSDQNIEQCPPKVSSSAI